MKKIITLIVLLGGFVGTASAWDHVYLRCGLTNESWNNDRYEFEKIDNNDFVIKLDASVVKDGLFYFRPRVDGYGQLQPRNGDADAVVNTSGYYEYGFDTSNNGTSYSFYLPQCSSATAVYIRVKFTGNDQNDVNIKWFRIIALVTEDITTVEYEESSSWSTVSAYASFDGIPLNRVWPGTAMTSAGGTKYTTTIPYKEGASIIVFDDGTGRTGSSYQTNDLPFVNNGCYSYSGLTGVKATITAAGIGTFCSSQNLTIPDGVNASYVTGINSGNYLTTTNFTDGIPANTGALIQGSAGTYTFTITNTPPTAASGNKLVHCLNTTAVPQTSGENRNYILTKKTVNGPVGTPMFYLVNSAGNTVTGGHAYLQLPSGTVAAREYFFLWDDTESIDNPQLTTDNPQIVFDLQGRRVQQPAKGLYIVDGKKVIK